MQVEVVVKCMQTKFGGRDHSTCSFRDSACFLFAFKMAKFPIRTMDYSPWGSKIESAQKIHANRDWRKMHVNQFWWAWPEILLIFHGL